MRVVPFCGAASGRRWIGAASLWGRKYPIPQESHSVEAMVDEIKTGMQLVREGSASSMKEGSNVLERGCMIASSAFGESAEATLFVRHALCVSLFRAGRFGSCEKNLRLLLNVVDSTSTIDRFELRVMLADCLRKLGRSEEALQACAAESEDSTEQKLEMLARQAWLARESGGKEPPHELLNEATRLIETLEKRTFALAKYSAVILAIQGLISLEAGRWEQALERGQRGQQVIQQYRSVAGEAKVDQNNFFFFLSSYFEGFCRR